jgi:hypothetical protein
LGFHLELILAVLLQEGLYHLMRVDACQITSVDKQSCNVVAVLEGLYLDGEFKRVVLGQKV